MEGSVVKLGLKDSIRHSIVVLPLIMFFEALLIVNWLVNTDDKTSIGSLGYLYCYISLLVVTLFAYGFQRLVWKDFERHYRKLVNLHYFYVTFIMVWCTVFTYIGSEYHGSFDYLLFVTIVTLAPIINFMRPAFWYTLQLSCTAAVYIMASHHPHYFSFVVNFSVFTIISVIVGWFVYKVRRSGYERMITLNNEANRDAFLNRVGYSLLRDYQTIFLIDLQTGMATPIKVEETQNASKMVLPERFEYQTFVDSYQERFDTELFDEGNIPDFEVVRQHFSKSAEPLSIRYRASKNAAGQEYFEIVLALIDDDSRNVVLAVKGIDDIVDEIYQQKKALEEAMKQAEKAHHQAEIANKAKSNFLFNMSHDIRTPMNAILGFTNMMENELDDITKLKDHLHKVKNSGEFLLSLINNVLDMARIESGNAKVEEQIYDLTDPNNNAISLFEEQMAAKHITYKQSLDVKHPTVMLDKMKIHQIMMNIISNAVKYTPDGGTIETSFTEVSSERDGYGKYVFLCKDTGIGMTKEFAEHLFEMFSRERNTTSSGVMGVGLGMAIVKKLVDLLGGTIDVDTEPGKGTTFTVTLWHKIVDNPEPLEADKQSTGTITFEGKRLLIAEDNDLNAEIVMTLLKDVGIEAERAEDGEKCIKMLCEAAPGYYDAILMDIQMPHLNGYDATRQIRSLDDVAKSNIAIIAITANAFDEDKREAIRSGMNGHLSKPINIHTLRKELVRVFEGKGQEGDI